MYTKNGLSLLALMKSMDFCVQRRVMVRWSTGSSTIFSSSNSGVFHLVSVDSGSAQRIYIPCKTPRGLPLLSG